MMLCTMKSSYCSQQLPFLVTRGIKKMSNYESNKIHQKFSKQQAECLLKTMENEWERWGNLIAFNRSASGNSSIAADYEYDSIQLDDLITGMKASLKKLTFAENSFDYTEAACIIAALDNEFDSYQEKKSSLSEEEFNLLMGIREKLKETAIEEFGDEVLTWGHYQRGKNDNRE